MESSAGEVPHLVRVVGEDFCRKAEKLVGAGRWIAENGPRSRNCVYPRSGKDQKIQCIC